MKKNILLHIHQEGTLEVFDIHTELADGIDTYLAAIKELAVQVSLVRSIHVLSDFFKVLDF